MKTTEQALREGITQKWWKLATKTEAGKKLMPSPKEHKNLIGSKGKWLDAAIEAIKEADWVKLDSAERTHILETQETLCKLGRSEGDDGGCSICRSIKQALKST